MNTTVFFKFWWQPYPPPPQVETVRFSQYLVRDGSKHADTVFSHLYILGAVVLSYMLQYKRCVTHHSGSCTFAAFSNGACFVMLWDLVQQNNKNSSRLSHTMLCNLQLNSQHVTYPSFFLSCEPETRGRHIVDFRTLRHITDFRTLSISMGGKHALGQFTQVISKVKQNGRLLDSNVFCFCICF